jgi:hypothetical protein
MNVLCASAGVKILALIANVVTSVPAGAGVMLGACARAQRRSLRSFALALIVRDGVSRRVSSSPWAPPSSSKPPPRARALRFGRVIDATTGRPIAGAIVTLFGTAALPPPRAGTRQARLVPG